MPEIETEVWGAGSRAVLVHGSLSTGPLAWEAQRPQGDEGYQLVVATRRAYTARPPEVGEDFHTDGDDVAGLLGDGAHLVGHSYGAVTAMVAAAARPEAVRSLVLAEPPLFGVTDDDPDVARLQAELEEVFARPGDDREFLERFLAAVGTPLEDLPPALLGELTDLTPALRRGRPPWSDPPSVDDLVDAPFPTVMVSGNHHPAFSAVCESLARRLCARHRVVEGAGHEMQMVADDFNAVLRSVWREAS